MHSPRRRTIDRASSAPLLALPDMASEGISLMLKPLKDVVVNSK